MNRCPKCKTRLAGCPPVYRTSDELIDFVVGQHVRDQRDEARRRLGILRGALKLQLSAAVLLVIISACAMAAGESVWTWAFAGLGWVVAAVTCGAFFDWRRVNGVSEKDVGGGQSKGKAQVQQGPGPFPRP